MSEQIYSTVPGGETTTIHTKEQRTVTRRTTRQGLHGPEQEEEIEVTTTEHTETIMPMIALQVRPSSVDISMSAICDDAGEASRRLSKATRDGLGSYSLGDGQH